MLVIPFFFATLDEGGREKPPEQACRFGAKQVAKVEGPVATDQWQYVPRRDKKRDTGEEERWRCCDEEQGATPQY